EPRVDRPRPWSNGSGTTPPRSTRDRRVSGETLAARASRRPRPQQNCGNHTYRSAVAGTLADRLSGRPTVRPGNPAGAKYRGRPTGWYCKTVRRRVSEGWERRVPFA